MRDSPPNETINISVEMVNCTRSYPVGAHHTKCYLASESEISGGVTYENQINSTYKSTENLLHPQRRITRQVLNVY